MWKKIRRILMIVLAAVFLFCGGTVAVVQHQYAVSKRLYRAASESFTAPAQLSAQKTSETPKTEGKTSTGPNDGIFRLPEYAPIKVDFESLLKVNKDVDGWIYCPDTVIDYPVVQHTDNDYYLNYNVNGEQNASGAIFLESANFSDFRDVNNILHGHHMGDGSMFASLDHWQADKYYDSHPVMYLNTPSGNYRVDLFAGFTTPANSRAYQYEFSGRSDIQNWIDWVRKESVIKPEVTLSVEDRFITLSTCAYSYENARTVLIGRLTPLG